jgi:hypothetical protein
VLAAKRERLLTYTLGDNPTTFVTWRIRAIGDKTAGGSIVRLYVDEPQPGADTPEEAEDAWLPVLAARQTVLTQSVLEP